MINKFKHITTLVVAGVFFFASLSAEAAVLYKGIGQLSPGMPFWPTGNSIGRGKLKFYPELAVGVVYDDNIFYDSDNKESDVITHVIPRLMIDYSLEERGSIKLGYAGDFAFYADFSDNDWEKHDVGFQLDYKAPSGLFLDVANDYVNTSDPSGSKEDYALGQDKDRWYNLFGAGLGYNHDDRLKIVGYFNCNKQEDFAAITGLKKLGIEKIPPIVARGVLLDMAAHFGVKNLEAGPTFNAEDIKATAKKQGVEIREGDVVLIHTGWIDHVLPNDPKKWGSTAPGPTEDAVEYLASKNIIAAGIDTWSFDPIPPDKEGRPFQGHVILFFDGIYILEAMNTGPLAADKAYEFLFVLGQARVRGAVQMIINPVAIR